MIDRCAAAERCADCEREDAQLSRGTGLGDPDGRCDWLAQRQHRGHGLCALGQVRAEEGRTHRQGEAVLPLHTFVLCFCFMFLCFAWHHVIEVPTPCP